MSNFSSAYKMYLLGYAGEVGGRVQEMISERQAQALVLGVHHRTTSKPPLMSSVAVVAELRAMSAPSLGYNKLPMGRLNRISPKLSLNGDLTLVSVGRDKIAAIKVLRDITHLGLRETKDLVDIAIGSSHYGEDHRITYSGGKSVKILENRPDYVETAAKLLRDAGCTVEVS